MAVLTLHSCPCVDRGAASGEGRGEDPAVGRGDAGERQGTADGPLARAGAKARGTAELRGRQCQGH